MRNEEMLEAVRKRLSARIEQLREEVGSDVDSDQSAREYVGRHDVLDAGEIAAEREQSGLRGELDALHVGEALYLEAALHRLAVGSYGVCVDCHREIDPARLMANPAVERCQACQEYREKAARHAAFDRPVAVPAR